MSAPGPDITTLQTENAALRHEIQGLKERVASLERNSGVQCICTHVKKCCKLCSSADVGCSRTHDKDG